MVKPPWQPVGLGVTGGALLLVLTLVDILVAVFTFLGLGLVFFVFVAFFTLRIHMFPDKGKFGLSVVIKKVFLPVFGVMTFLTDIPQFVFMDILFFVAIYALCGYRLVLPIGMTLLALCVYMFAVQLIPLVLWGLMLKQGRFPPFKVMAGLALVTLELPLVVILMAVAGFTVLGIQGLEPTLGMALLALGLYVLTFQLVPLVLRSLMLEEGRPPSLQIMTFLALITLKLPLVDVLMAVGSIACFIVKWFIAVLRVTFLALCIYVLPFQLIPLVFRGLMLKEGRLPAFYVMACIAFLVLELLFVRIKVTC